MGKFNLSSKLQDYEASIQEASGASIASTTATLEPPAPIQNSPTNANVQNKYDTMQAASEIGNLGLFRYGDKTQEMYNKLPAVTKMGVEMSPYIAGGGLTKGFNLAEKLGTGLASRLAGFGAKEFAAGAAGSLLAGTPEEGVGTGATFAGTGLALKGIGAAAIKGVSTLAEKLNAPLNGDQILSKVDKMLTPEKKQSDIMSKIKDIPKSFQEMFTSRFARLKSMESDVLKQHNLPQPDVNLTKKVELLKGAAGKADADLIDFRNNVIAPVKDSYQDFKRYVVMKRIADRLETDPTLRKVGDWTLQDAKTGLDTLESKLGPEKFKLIQDSGINYQNEMDKSLRLQVDSGRMSEEAYQAIKKSNDFYAPFKVLKYMGEHSDLAGAGSKVATTQNLTQKIIGMTSEDIHIKDPILESTKLIQKSRILAEKNKVMLQVGDLANLDNSGKYAVLEDQMGKIKNPTDFQKVSYLENGESKSVYLNKDIAKAVGSFNEAQGGMLKNILAAGATPFKMGATAYNIPFQMRNIAFSDMPRLALMSKYGIKSPVDIARFMGDSVHGIYTAFKGNFGEANKLYREYLESGAANSTIARTLSPKSFEHTYVNKSIGRSIISTPAKFANAIEESTKLTGFKRGLRIENVKNLEGDARKQAIERIATEVRNYAGSPDFGKMGLAGPTSNVLFMFSNANIQGTAADLARMGGKEGGKAAAQTAGRLTTGIVIPTITLNRLNQSDQYKQDYDQLSDEEKKNYWNIPRDTFFTNAHGEKVREFYRIPKRGTIRLVANVAEDADNFFRGKDPEVYRRTTDDILDGILPINVSGKNIQERTESIISSSNPLIKGPIEFGTKRNTWQHRNIIPEKFNSFPAEDQGYPNTPKPLKMLSRITKQSPLVLAQLANTFTGGASNLVLPSSPTEGRNVLAKFPLTKSFFRSEFTNKDEHLKIIDKYTQEEGAKRSDLYRNAYQWIQDNKSKPYEERKGLFSKLDKALKHEINKQSMQTIYGITYVEQKLDSLGVKNGDKAKAISEILDTFRTPVERKAYVNKLKKTGIVSDEVIRQLNNLRKNK